LNKSQPPNTTQVLYITIFLFSITSIATIGITKSRTKEKKSGKSDYNSTKTEGFFIYSANNNISTKKECFHAKVTSIRNDLVSKFQRE